MIDIKKIRREFHKYPEVGWKEIRTSARIHEILKDLGYKTILTGSDVVDADKILHLVKPSEEEKKELMKTAIKQGANTKLVEEACGMPGVIAEFDTGIEGEVTAFRFDIDSLPYNEFQGDGYEPSEKGYASINNGATHSCGHDGHTAIGIGIAEKLINGNYLKSGKVRLIFQPAEETFSGAESIVSKGHLDDVTHFIALHLALTAEGKPLPSNSMCCGCNDFLSDRQLDVYYTGKAAHPCGASQEGKNALLAACTAALNLHAIAPHEAGLFRINVGEIHGGVAPNTIAPDAFLRVEYRGETPEITAYGRDRVETILKASADMYSTEMKIVDYGEIPAGKSDNSMMKIIETAAKKVPWFNNIHFEGNVGGTDDATVMMTAVQKNSGIATYIGIGTDTTDPVHGDRFDFDEDCLEAAVDLCVNALSNIHK